MCGFMQRAEQEHQQDSVDNHCGPDPERIGKIEDAATGQDKGGEMLRKPPDTGGIGLLRGCAERLARHEIWVGDKIFHVPKTIN